MVVRLMFSEDDSTSIKPEGGIHLNLTEQELAGGEFRNRRRITMRMFNWERLWRGAGIGYVVLLLVASVFYGTQPGLGASTGKLVAFFDGDRTHILIAAVIFCCGFLELLWFGSALSSLLRDARKEVWASAVTASSAAFAALLFVRMTVRATLALSIAGSGASQATHAFADLGWGLTVIGAFPSGMFVLATAFGLSRAHLISKKLFSTGVVAGALALLGGTTWASHGFWAPDGGFQNISQFVVFAWIVVISGVLAKRMPSRSRANEVVLDTPVTLDPTA
jgi:hypothetical protein